VWNANPYVKKMYLLVIDNEKKLEEQKPALLLTIKGETLQAMNLDDACRYLGYWGTGNGLNWQHFYWRFVTR